MSPRGGGAARPLWVAALLAVALVIGLATLTPSREPPVAELRSGTAWGETALADTVRNVLLFLPLGIALALRGASLGRIVTTGALASLAIELAQLTIPGRSPAASDVVCNAAGTALGGAVALARARWLAPSTHSAGRLCLGAALSAACVALASARLFMPALPATRYFGGWTPEMGQYERYRGRVLGAALGGVAIESGPLAASAELRERLAAGEKLVVRAEAGPPSERLAALLTIHDELQREILLLGVEGDDLVFRTRTLAAALRLENPELRAPDALRGLDPGAALTLQVSGEGASRCVSVNESSQCGLGYDVGSGWRLLAPRTSVPRALEPLGSGLWLAGLALPFGFWLRLNRASVAAAGVFGAALLAASWAGPLHGTAAADYLAGALGAACGAALSRWTRRVYARDASPAKGRSG